MFWSGGPTRASELAVTFVSNLRARKRANQEEFYELAKIGLAAGKLPACETKYFEEENERDGGRA